MGVSHERRGPMRRVRVRRIDGEGLVRQLTHRLSVLALVVLVGCSTGTNATSTGAATTTPSAPGAVETTTTANPTGTATLLPGVDPVLGIVPPEPTQIPFVQNSWDHIYYLKACMEAAGYAVEIIPGANPAAASDAPPTPRGNEVAERCLYGLPRERGWMVPTPFDGSEAGNRLLYEIQREFHDCLVEHDYPTVEPPSEEAFVEEGASLWNPFDAMMGSELAAAPDADHGPSGTMPPMVALQLEAQDQCGASPVEIYAQRLRDRG